MHIGTAFFHCLGYFCRPKSNQANAAQIVSDATVNHHGPQRIGIKRKIRNNSHHPAERFCEGDGATSVDFSEGFIVPSPLPPAHLISYSPLGTASTPDLHALSVKFVWDALSHLPHSASARLPKYSVRSKNTIPKSENVRRIAGERIVATIFALPLRPDQKS